MALFHWLDGSLTAAERLDRSLIVDSWLTETGHTRLLAAHFARFERSCTALGFGREDFADFFDAVTAQLPEAGRHFPKISCSADGDLGLELRPAPSAETVAHLLVHNDSRQMPQHKGPDLNDLMRLREQAVAQGATDALLVDANGFVIEAATAGLVWWEGDTLCVPSSPRVMPSVSTTLVQELVQLAGYRVALRERTPAQLAGCEVWSINSLHALRVVESVLVPDVDVAEVHVVKTGEARFADEFRRQILAV